MGSASAPGGETGSSPASADTHTRDRWRWLDQVLADPEVTPFAFQVAYVIASHVSRETGDAWPGQARIAEKAKGTERGVRNAIDALQARGHLRVDRRQGRKDTNRYRMAFEYRNGGSGNGAHSPSSDLFEAHDHRNSGSGIDQVDRNGGSGNRGEYRNGGSSLTGTAVPLIPMREPKEEDIYPHPKNVVGGGGAQPKSPTSDADFAEFWAQVPLQREEVETRRAYDKAIHSGKVTHAQLMAGIARYAAERMGENPRYTKHPANWISKGCWKDNHHSPSMLLPINGGRHPSVSNGHVPARSMSGTSSAAYGIAAGARALRGK